MSNDKSHKLRLKKYAVSAGIIWCVAISVSLYVNYSQRTRHISEIGITIARASFDKDILYRRWNASNGGVYARRSDFTPTNPYLTVPEKNIITPQGVKLTMVNPAYMTRQVHELGASQNGVQGHITSLNPLRPENGPDEWERKALELFEGGTKEVSSIELFRGERYLRFMKPLVIEKGCLVCHRNQGYQLGQIRGGISQSVPFSLLQKTGASSLWPLWVGHFILFFVGIVFIQNAYSRLLRSMTDLCVSREELLRSNNELKLSQSRLLQSEKMASVGQLAAGVAHEINNPIGFITSNLGTLSKYLSKLTNFIVCQKKCIEECQDLQLTDRIKALEKDFKLGFIVDDISDLISESLDGSERVQTIVKNLKTFSRVDQNDLQQLNINECIESSLSIIWNELKYKVTIEKEYGDLPTVDCYPQQLGQVFMNLIINASHAIEDQGLVIISSWAKDGSVYVSIADNGCGIAEENLQRIFEPFFTTKEIGKGTGLGLSMVYDIVKNHNGQIDVRSTLGEGTIFTVRIPEQGLPKGKAGY